jgi:hypothetical protein
MGFRYRLTLEDGQPADPAVFVVAVPDWRVGDTFRASNGQRFRILAIKPEPEPDPERASEFHAEWVVEPVDIAA